MAQGSRLRKQGLKQIDISKKLKISQPAVSLFEKNIRLKVRDSVEILDVIKKLNVKIK